MATGEMVVVDWAVEGRAGEAPEVVESAAETMEAGEMAVGE